MKYKFPAGIHKDEISEVIQWHNERLGVRAFIEADKGDHTVFNYLVAFDGSFPEPNTGDPDLDRKYAILRECRGLIVSNKTGEPIARRYPKFFNINEKPETQSGVLPWDEPHVVLEKLDGSMITPFRADSGKMLWGTKMGFTEVAYPVAEFVAQRNVYNNLAWECYETKKTPIFEWCSRKQKIVIDYPVDQLVLTGIRDNHTGEFTSYNDMVAKADEWGVPVVQAASIRSVSDVEKFLTEVQDVKGMEGYVVRWENGHMAKGKGAEYVLIHRTKETLQFEKDVLDIILSEKVDDIKPYLDDDDKARIDQYMADLYGIIDRKGSHYVAEVERAKVLCGGDKKKFAMEFVNSNGYKPFEKPILFLIWDGVEPTKVISDYIAKNSNSQPRIDAIRDFLEGLNWNDYKFKSLNEDEMKL